MHAHVIKIVEHVFIRQLLRQRYSFETIYYYLTTIIKTDLVLNLTGLGHG